MTMGAGLFGASLGIFVKMASNSMRKIPLRRGKGLGCGVMRAWVGWVPRGELEELAGSEQMKDALYGLPPYVHGAGSTTCTSSRADKGEERAHFRHA